MQRATTSNWRICAYVQIGRIPGPAKPVPDLGTRARAAAGMGLCWPLREGTRALAHFTKPFVLSKAAVGVGAVSGDSWTGAKDGNNLALKSLLYFPRHE